MTKTLNEQDWDSFNSRLKNNEIVVIDNFFTNMFLSILKIRVLYSKYFDDDYEEYAAINYVIPKSLKKYRDFKLIDLSKGQETAQYKFIQEYIR